MKRSVKKQKMKKNNGTSVYSGRALHGRRAILASEAVDYLRSLGHLVSNKAFILTMFVFLIITLGGVFVSAQTISYLNSSGISKDIGGGYCSALSSAQVYNQTWLNFNGTNNNNVLLPYLYLDDNLTYTFWFKKTGTGDQYPFSFMKTGVKISDTYYNWYPSLSGGSRAFAWVNNSLWNFFAVTVYRKNATNFSCIIYNSSSSRTYSGDCYQISKTNFSNYLGRSSTSAFNGSIDDLRIFNSSLSTNTIREIQNNRGKNLTKGIPILSYHQIRDTGGSSTDVNTTDFNNQMSWLSAQGFHTIRFRDLVQWQSGNFTMPSKPFIISFDDGTDNDILNAKPIMDLYGFVGCSNIITGNTNKSGYMNITQLNTLISAGWEIASHTENHCNLITNCNTSYNWTHEFNESQWYLEHNLANGYKVTSFIYPYTYYNSTTNAIADDYYTFVGGWDTYITAIEPLSYGYLDSNLITGFGRIALDNHTEFSEFQDAMNQEYKLVFHLKLNENSGTTAYDSSGNGNNGTISGATWQNDGVLVSLTQDTDYDFNSPMFRLLNPRYDFSNITLTSSFLGHWFVNQTYKDWYPISECINESQDWQKIIYQYDYNNCGNYTPEYFYINGTLACTGVYTGMFTLDLESRTTMVILGFLFIFVILFLWFRKFIFAGGLLVIIGFLLLFNGFSTIVSLVIILGGILAFFLK